MLRRRSSRCCASRRASSQTTSSSATVNAVIICMPTRANAMSAGPAVRRLVELAAVRRRPCRRLRRGSRPSSACRCRCPAAPAPPAVPSFLYSAIAASSSASFLPTSVVEPPQRVALRDACRSATSSFAQAVERAVDLRHRGVVGLEVFVLAGQQVAALAGLGVDDQRQRLVQRRPAFRARPPSAGWRSRGGDSRAPHRRRSRATRRSPAPAG